ncbi:hypothetical protein [Algoriphagus hitonicola]|uniref:hypothetical protein n=1 Tax=Algoriphagus hitonicola TaxID=435880 RepID=UPI00360F414B
MKLTIRPIVFLLLSVFAFVACEEEDKNPINPLTADAGDPEVGFVGFATILDGSLSTNSMGKPFAYQWEVNSKPTGSTATIENENEVFAKLIGTLPGNIKLHLPFPT